MATSQSDAWEKIGNRIFMNPKPIREWEAANPELAKAWDEAWEDDEKWEAKAAKKRRFAGAPECLAHLGVPETVIASLKAGLTQTAALDAVTEWRKGKNAFLLLLGGVGSGKTSAAAKTIWDEFVEGGEEEVRGWAPRVDALFVPAYRLNGFSDYDKHHREWLKEICGTELLILDDLGTERMGDGELSCVQRIVSERHARLRKTIITSNLTAKAFKERYGDRVVDRIREVGTIKASGTDSLRKPPQ